MRIVRYKDNWGNISHGLEQADGVHRITGSLFGEYNVAADLVDVKKLLAPIEPPTIYCIGLNYLFHACLLYTSDAADE